MSTEVDSRVVWVVRHADRLDFADPAWAASATHPYDPPLSPMGTRQARALAARLSTEAIAHLFSSPFLRCVESALAIARTHGLCVKIEDGLSEWLNVGWFRNPPELQPVADLAARYTHVDTAYSSRGQARFGESGEEAIRRSATTCLRLANDFEGNLLLVGHGASVLGSLTGLIGQSAVKGAFADAPYCSLSKVIRPAGGNWRLAYAGDVSHLPRISGPGQFLGWADNDGKDNIPD
ncbi:MAG: histidine phosphatase family protein [Gammaproteobacteria bacterium]|nr:histidine phosphatase family protein [Gammaproteobacteria bacterium]MDH5215626.1 histidine phosphatase family protein [Gammaproteobacteria bacterium]